MQAIKKIVEAEKIDCDFTLCRTIDVWCNAEAAKKARKIYDLMRELEGFEYLDDVVFYDGEEVEGVSDLALFSKLGSTGRAWRSSRRGSLAVFKVGRTGRA